MAEEAQFEHACNHLWPGLYRRRNSGVRMRLHGGHGEAGDAGCAAAGMLWMCAVHAHGGQSSALTGHVVLPCAEGSGPRRVPPVRLRCVDHPDAVAFQDCCPVGHHR